MLRRNVLGAAALGIGLVAASPSHASTVNDAILAKINNAGGVPQAITYHDVDATTVLVDAGNNFTASIGDILLGKFSITVLANASNTAFALLGVDNFGASKALLPLQELTGIYELEVTGVDAVTGKVSFGAVTAAGKASLPSGYTPLVDTYGSGSMIAVYREVLSDVNDADQYSNSGAGTLDATGGSLYAVMGFTGSATEYFNTTVTALSYLNYGTAATLQAGTNFAQGGFGLNQISTVQVQEIDQLKLLPLGDGNLFDGSQTLKSAGTPTGAFPFSSVTSIQILAVPTPTAALGGGALMVMLGVGAWKRSQRA